MYLECANDSNIEYDGDISRESDTHGQYSSSLNSAPNNLALYESVSRASTSRHPEQEHREIEHRKIEHRKIEHQELENQPCDLNFVLQKLPSLSASAAQKAMDYVLEFGTNLQRERLLYHFPSHKQKMKRQQREASKRNVLAALSHYQNEDGGFGHGLEADLRTKHSSVIATTVAIHILESIDALDSTLADGALQYLITHYQTSGWPAINDECNDAPHAPWWRFEAWSSKFQANPSVDVMKFILSRNAMPSERSSLIERAIAYIENEELDMHELLCYTRFYECDALTKTDRIAMLPHLLCHGYRLVNTEASDWEEYCLTPLSVVTHPRSIFAEFFADTLVENFEFLINSQNNDGSWSPNWSWAGEFPATWKTVETEIKAEMTLKMLLQFDAFESCSRQNG